jgi:DNA polymerase/3'-5' exonuclease PolX
MFNEKLRNIAKSKNMKLNEYALTKNGKELKIETEYDIFKKLDIDYVSPENRN